MSTERPRIALISATIAAIPAAAAALRTEFPAADVWNLVDDRLLGDADEQGGLTEPLAQRMRRLIRYAAEGGADGILLTCSLYGPVTREFDLPIPVLAPDQAAFEDLLVGRQSSILVVASFPVAMDDSSTRLRRWLSDNASISTVGGVVAADAFDAAKRGDNDAVAEALISACQAHVSEVDVVYLAQYSLAGAGPAVAEALKLPVVSGPVSAAAALRRALSGSEHVLADNPSRHGR